MYWYVVVIYIDAIKYLMIQYNINSYSTMLQIA